MTPPSKKREPPCDLKTRNCEIGTSEDYKHPITETAQKIEYNPSIHSVNEIKTDRKKLLDVT